MAVLVTGVGYIGAQLVKDLLKTGVEVVAVDNLFSTDGRVIAGLCREPGFRFIRGHVGRPDVLKRAFEASSPIDVVFSLAAQASAHASAASPRYTENTNLLAPRLLLDAMVARGIHTLVFASSFRVYGHDLPPVVGEDAPYGRFGDLSHLSKCYFEKLMEMYAGQHGLRCLSVRLGIVYGLGPVMKTDYRFMTAPNKFCLQVARRERISVSAQGCRPAGFIHVGDASRALQAVAGYEARGYTAINAVTEMMPVSAVAEAVVEGARRRGLDPEVAIEGEGQDSAVIPRVLSKLDGMGFRIGLDLRHGVGEMLDYFLGAR